MADEVAALQEQVELLRNEVRALKRQRWGNLALLAGGVALFCGAAANSQAPSKDLVCRSLKVVGSDGKEQVGITTNRNGGVVAVRGMDGRARVMAGVDHQAGFVDWLGADGKPRATLFIGDDGQAELDLLSNDGKKLAALEGTPVGGTIDVRGSDGTRRVLLGVDNAGGAVNILAHDGKSRIVAGVGYEGCGEIDLRDDAGRVRLILRSDQGSGSVECYDTQSKRRAKIP